MKNTYAVYRRVEGSRHAKWSQRALCRSLIVVALLWAGMLIGVSWIATPIKFAAPSLTMPVAFVGRARVVPLLLATVIAVLVLLQTIWLLPLLDARVDIVIAGGTPPASSLHLWYIIIEAVKLVLLFAIGVAGLIRQPAIAP